MKFAEVAENVRQLVESPPAKDEFIFELLLAYGTPKATIARLKAGQLNLAITPGDVLLKKKVWFRTVGPNVEQTSRLPNQDEPNDNKQAGRSLYVEIEKMKTAKAAKTNDPRFLIVVGDCREGTVENLPAAAGRSATMPALQKQTFNHLLAIDRKTGDTLDTDFQGLETHFDFFLPWAGMEKQKLSNESEADVKAAEKMAKLFDAIKQDNPDYLRHDIHAMNVFLARLLFCLFAEDTGIFPENAVSNAIASHTAEDGSDLDAFFKQLFDWLDTSDRERDFDRKGAKNAKGEQGQVFTTKHTNDTKIETNLTTETESKKTLRASVSSSEAGGKYPGIRNLPYVNGGLFRDHYDIPVFSAKSRRMLIEAGTLTWAEINPDIFGSMFQAVIDPEERHNLGQHYTSVTNIMKVIEPLFLNDFKEELERAKNLKQQKVRNEALHALHDRLAKVKIFDPACGSGNFLIIAYKELRKLEMELFEAMNAFPVSRITVDQFYGIEIADFACETATLSLWLAEHQMNLEYQKRFKQSLTSLPLKDGAHIVCGNACRIDWETVCSKNEGDEIYILGNPPYLGARMQSKDHKADMTTVFGKMQGANSLDYIACWFLKASEYIRGINAQFAFVSTNSLCQGEQVALLWPHVLNDDLEIGFAHQSFKWTNNAKGSAAVICVVVGVRSTGEKKKILYSFGLKKTVDHINAYLTASADVYIYRRSKPISKLPYLVFGNMPNDGGHLLLLREEMEALLEQAPIARRFIKRFVGAQEFLQGGQRWCLWIRDNELSLAESINEIGARIKAVQKKRLESERVATRELAKVPHRFGHISHRPGTAMLMPSATSERREYVPVGYVNDDTIISNLAHAIYGTEPHVFGVLSSRMHMIWIRAVAGRLKSDCRYSGAICYNNFPIPDLTEEQKQAITLHVGNVLEEREKHPEKTMAQLYDPDKMPAGLREAHHQLDLAVDRIYRSKPFSSDEERLEHLFKLYEEMTAKEKLI